MKKTLLILTLIFTTSLYAKLNIVVSIQPEMEFVHKIARDKIETTLIVKAGSSPHTYEPKPSQMIELSRANLYFAIGVEFEKKWLDRFKNQNKNLKVIDISKGIDKVEDNPHIWLNPIYVKKISKNIFKALSSLDRKNRDFYKQNLEKYLQELDILDKKIKDILKDTPKNSSFMVFHPAWGYFADRYNLKELAVEVNGKSPKMREIIDIIKRAKREKVKAIFTQPEFSDKSAKIIANNLNIDVIKASPLATDWANNLIDLAEAIAKRE